MVLLAKIGVGAAANCSAQALDEMLDGEPQTFFVGPFPTAGTARIPYQEEPQV